MPITRCTTCGQPLCICLRPQCTCQCPAPVCDCPPPPLPDTMGRVTQLYRDREAVLVWLARIPQQHDPTVVACVDAQIAQARTADEPTIQRMLRSAHLQRPHREGTGTYR